MTTRNDATQEKLMELVQRGVKLPALPSITSELMNLSHQAPDRIDVHHLVELIERDQSLTAAIVKLVNSPFYGRTRAVTQVGRALTLIGLNEGLQYLNYYMMKNLMPAFPTMPFLSQDSYFQHSWACATAARLMGRPQLLVESLPGELYLAGLMHDIGKVVLASQACAEFGQALQSAHDAGEPLFAKEIEVLELHHGTLGAYLLDEWNLPPSILDAVAYHHQPDQADPAHQELAGLIELADMIANLSGIGNGGNPVQFNVKDSWIHRFGKTRLSDPSLLESFVAEVQQELRKQAQMLHYVEIDGESDLEKTVNIPLDSIMRPDFPDSPEDAGAATLTQRALASSSTSGASADSVQGVWGRFLKCLTSLVGG